VGVVLDLEKVGSGLEHDFDVLGFTQTDILYGDGVGLEDDLGVPDLEDKCVRRPIDDLRLGLKIA